MRPRGILLLLLALAFAPGVRAAPKPNILFILCDDLGVNDLRCHGRADQEQWEKTWRWRKRMDTVLLEGR